MRSFAISRRFGIVALFLVLGLGAPSFGQPPAKALTAEQKEKLEESLRFSKESSALEKAGKLPEAIAAAEKMLALERSIFGDVHDDVAGSLQRLARMHERLENFAVAQKERTEALAIWTKLHGAKAWQVTNIRLELQDGEVLARLAPKARQELQEASQWMMKAFANDKSGKYEEGAACAEKALAIRLRLLGKENNQAGYSAKVAGSFWEDANQLKKSRVFYEQAVAIYKKALGDNHPGTAAVLNDLGFLLNRQGDYAAARLIHEQALDIYKKTLGDYHPNTAKSLDQLGWTLERQGDYTAARSYHEQALTIRKKVLGDNHRDTARSLDHLGSALLNQGDYSAARSYHEQALAIRKKVLGDNDSETATSLSSLGSLFARQRDYAAARPYLEQAYAIYKKVLGDNHPNTVASLSNLGSLLQDQGDYAAARPYYEQTVAFYKKVLGDEHHYTATALNNLGLLLRRSGDLAAARPYFEQALAIRKKVLGGHPEIAASLNNLGALLNNQGDPAAARPYYEQALALTRRTLDLAAEGQSERQQLHMIASLRFQFAGFLSLRDDTEAHTASAYAQVLAWKGSVLARQQRLRLERQNPKLAPLVAELRKISGELAALAFATPDPKKRDEWNRQLEKLTTDKEALERELAQKSQTFRQDQELKNLPPSKFLELLPAETALVDFLVYRHGQLDPNQKNKWYYHDRLTAYVLKPGAAIVRIDLGPMEPIEKVIDQWRDAYKKQLGKAHPGMELRRLLWLPLEKHLAGAKTVIISPDEALGRLPFAALPGSKEGSYLLEDVAVSVVPVPRLLPALLGKNKDEPGKEPSLLLVGDIDFDAVAGKADDGARVAATGARKAWNRLPGTKGEILVIRDAFEQRFADGKLKILRGEQATQSSLRELASKYSHLHLATHGFFAPPEVRSALAGDDKNLFGAQGVKSFHPGLLSGLVFAGANKQPAPGQSDGILTALEVAELDLSKVELAVLSACETGLGKVAAGEGILGLQRAFQVAGAKSVVASLWSVDDEATRKLMERFYENHWQKKMSRADALRQAQLAMLRGELVRGIVLQPEETVGPRRVPPYFWAAFVLSGDWR